MTSPSTSGQLHTALVDSLGIQIVGGALAAGTVFTLDAIARQYAVSAPVAREAVRVIETLGLVASRRRVGITVQPSQAWNVFDPLLIRWRLAGDGRVEQLRSLGELRLGFEPVAAALAARRATPEQCRDLAAAVNDMTMFGRLGDLDRYLAADVAFHTGLLRASGNEMFAALNGIVSEVLHGRTHHHLMPDVPNPEAIDLHHQVAAAVRSADPQAAEAAMRAIIVEATEAIQRPSDPRTRHVESTG